MYYLKKIYKFAFFDFKLYRPNLITNNVYINHYQKVHRDCKIKFPKIVVTFLSSSAEKNELRQVIRKKLFNETKSTSRA